MRSLGLWSMLLTSGLMAASKYAVIDMQYVIVNVEEGKAARASLEKEFKAKEKELTKEKEQLDKMNEEWKSQAAVLSESARMKKQQEFQEKFMSLRNSEMEFQQEIKRKEQKATQAIAVKVNKIVDEIAKQKQFEVVFETNTAGVVFVKDPEDITKLVIEKYAKAPATAVKEKK